jgi:hypothetical protein
MSALGAIARTVLALFACFLPRPAWAAWSDRLPVFRMALASGVLTLGAGLAFGVVGYLDFVVDAASRTNAAMLQVAERQADRAGDGEIEVSPGMSVSLTMLAALTYALFTARGLSCSYLVLSGLYRTMAALANDPSGDPLLTLLRGAARRAAGRTRETVKRLDRERREGREVPDRLLPGPEAGLPRADLVVIAARRKADWAAGTALVTQMGCFRVGDAVERETDEGLRTLYPLHEIGEAEVMRKMVRFELPGLEIPLPDYEATRR